MIHIKKDKLIPAIIIFSLIGGGLIWNTIKRNDLDEHQKITNGKITSFYKIGGKIRYYGLVYEYQVDDNQYKGFESVEYFECIENEKIIAGCVDRTFKVRYSSNNPENSILDLGEFNKYKHKLPSTPIQ